MIMFQTGLADETVIARELDQLCQQLHIIFSAEEFYKAHEFLDRNRITSNRKKISKASRHFRLKPFRFFINKN